MATLRKMHLPALILLATAPFAEVSAQDDSMRSAADKDRLGCYVTINTEQEYILLTTEYIAWTRKGNRTVLRYTWADKGVTVYQYGPYRKVNMALSWEGNTLVWSTYDAQGKPTGVRYERTETVPQILQIEPITPKAVSPPPSSVVSDIETKLLAHFREEQAIRQQFSAMTKGRRDDATLLKPKIREFHAKVQAVDDRNREYLRNCLREHGWPSLYSKSPKVLEAAFFIALHSEDLQIMRTAEAALRSRNKRNYAMVSDRIRLLTNEPLLYGVQASVDHLGQPYIPILADRAVVNANRTSIGEPPIETVEKRGIRIDEIEAPEPHHAGQNKSSVRGDPRR